MPVYQLTNKLTYARAVVVAPNIETARGLRPDGKAYWRHGRWNAYTTLGAPSSSAPPLPCWPDEIDFVHADELAARASRGFEGTTHVVAFTSDETPRIKGDGPDESWGVSKRPDLLTLSMFESEDEDD